MISSPRKTALRFFTPLAALALIALFVVPAAHAEGSFLLQLGTFETRDEATAKWNDVKKANGDILGGLKGHIAEVMLPPDNTATYRTQVGPVDSRHAAKSLCKALVARNVQCFVVETAFAAADLAPEMAGDVSGALPAPAVIADAALAPAPKAPTPAEQITSSPVSPIEVTHVEAAPASMVAAPAPAPIETAQAEAPVTPQKTYVTTERRHSGNFNPNDMKKPGFFRGTFDMNDQNESSSEETVAEAPAAPQQITKTSTADDDDQPGFFGRLFGRSSHKKEEATAPVAVATETPAPTPAPVAVTLPVASGANVKGDVEVAEAVRVPVSGASEHARYVPATDSQASAAESYGAYWLQIGYFSNENAAQGFYAHLQQSVPDALSGTRVRITHPFAKRSARASLRIGTLSSASAIKSVCAQAKARGLRCTSFRDTGALESYAASQPATPVPTKRKYLSPLDEVEIPGYRAPGGKVAYVPAESVTSSTASPIAITNPAPSGNSAIGEQWVNLGGYPTTQAAWNQWKALQGSIPSLADIKPAITGMLGGKANEKFQLRAGPIVTDIDAENICKAVVNTGNVCAVAATE